MNKHIITPRMVLDAATRIAQKRNIGEGTRVYGVPRGGAPVALTVAALTGAEPVAYVDDADIIVDDVYDSGATYNRYAPILGGRPFEVLFDKRTQPWHGHWLVLPWEADDDNDNSATDAVVRLLQAIGEDPTREGLRETPARVVRAWQQEWCSGYGQDPADVLKVFEDGADGVNELVVMRDIPIHSHCEHHLSPFVGTAVIGYIPKGKIVGLSKLDRLANIFARRLQVQERLTNQIADALMEHLDPVGAGVIIECQHTCMSTRGVRSNAPTITSALRGALYDDPRARAEFLALRAR